MALTGPGSQGVRESIADITQQSIDYAGLGEVYTACIAHFNSVGDAIAYLGNFGIGFLGDLKGGHFLLPCYVVFSG